MGDGVCGGVSSGFVLDAWECKIRDLEEMGQLMCVLGRRFRGDIHWSVVVRL